MKKNTTSRKHTVKSQSAYRTWKVLDVSGKTFEELMAQFAEIKLSNGIIGIEVSNWARDIAPACDFLQETEEKVPFVKGSLRDLFGFKQNSKTQLFLNEAFLAKHGLELCKPSDAFYLRLVYLYQPLDNKAVRIGMNPIADSISYFRVFSLCNYWGSGTWVRTYSANPERRHNPGSTWVFRILSKQQK